MGKFDRDGSTVISGRRFAWRRLGTGPPLLLVQGYAGTADDWPPEFLGALGRSFSLVMPDNRGMGDSELGNPDDVTIDSMAADLVELLDELAIECLPVVGFSMGGFIAQAFAAVAPQRVELLALISTDPGGPGAIRADPGDWARLVDHSGTARERASRTISVIFPPDVAPQFDRDFGELVAAAQAAMDPRALAAEERAMEWWWAAAPGPAVAVAGPVLIVAGADDIIIPPGNVESLAGRFPGARVELFAGTGHAVPAQQAAPVADLIRSRIRL